MSSSLHILINGNDTVLIEILTVYFNQNGHSLIHLADNNKAFELFSKSIPFDACVIDDFSSEGNENAVLIAQIRKKNHNIPILFISKITISSYKVKVLKEGADAFVNKPFEAEELLLRIQAFVRRTRENVKLPKFQQATNSVIKIGKYTFDHNYHKLYFGEKTQKLTARESELLHFFYLRKGEIIKRHFILREIWGENDKYKSRSMDVFISRLRKYLSKDAAIKIINTPHVGLQFVF